ncbi:MAG TPA: hypothetical protein VMI56_21020 [Reyranella sp.]|nr:hypothetical protein [Reyranella sp.]
MTDETTSASDQTTASPAPQPADPAPAPPAPTPAASEPSLLAQGASEPAAYESFKLPEGAAIDPEQLASATELFRASALSQEQAQKFIDLAVSRDQAAAQKGAAAFEELQNQWVQQAKADPEIGGNRFGASLASASRAIDRLGVPGLREALNLTGAGNHPAVVKAFVRLGQMVSEDRFLPGKDAAPAAPRSPAEVIYDGSPRQ